jgi:peroxiredoxin/predicted negative regulator of RcsB-dependent stress response
MKEFKSVKASITIFASMLVVAAVSGTSGAEPPARSVAEIQARHDRAFIRELTEYLGQNPRAGDREQAYAALFNKAIEHDWFAEVEDLGRQYLKSDPDGPVKALAQIVTTMARAQAGRYDEALARFRGLIKGLEGDEQEEFATSFSDTFAVAAIAAGEYNIARQAYAALLDRFGESPRLREKVQADLKRLDQVGKTAPAFTAEDIDGRPVRSGGLRGKYVLVDFWATWCGPCVAELPRLQAAYVAYHDAGLEIVGVSLDESKQAVVDFVKARKVPWPQIHNAGGASDLVQAFGVVSIPATYLIDTEGTIIRLDLRGKALDEALAQLLKRPAAATGAR